MFEKIFASDKISKQERVIRTLNHKPVDRVAIHEQVSFNPGVIELYTGKKINGFNYTEDDICAVIRQTLDMCFPPIPPFGRATITDADGFVMKNDDWTTWIVNRPFSDEVGAAEWMKKKIRALKEKKFDPVAEKEAYRRESLRIQEKIGETVLCRYHDIGLCDIWRLMEIDVFTFFNYEYPELLNEYMDLYVDEKVRWINAAADISLSPVILIADDFATKQGPLFGPDLLGQYLYPNLKKIAAAWKSHGYKVLFHSDGNWKKVIPDLIATGVDGFYCLEPACGMDVVELKKQYPEMVWAGGVDGVQLMEYGTPEQVEAEVLRHINETNVLNTGGMFLASSSEINPPVKPENFKAMIDTAGKCLNGNFGTDCA